jgi:hypothetical protein
MGNAADTAYYPSRGIPHDLHSSRLRCLRPQSGNRSSYHITSLVAFFLAAAVCGSGSHFSQSSTAQDGRLLSCFGRPIDTVSIESQRWNCRLWQLVISQLERQVGGDRIRDVSVVIYSTVQILSLALAARDRRIAQRHKNDDMQRTCWQVAGTIHSL